MQLVPWEAGTSCTPGWTWMAAKQRQQRYVMLGAGQVPCLAQMDDCACHAQPSCLLPSARCYIMGGGICLILIQLPALVNALVLQAEQKKKEETEAKRLEALPAFLRGRSFAAEDDESVTAFEGASPAEIQALALKLRRTHGLSSVSSPSSFSPGVAGMGMAFRGGEGGSREDQPGIGQLMQGGRWALPGLEEEDPYEVSERVEAGECERAMVSSGLCLRTALCPTMWPVCFAATGAATCQWQHACFKSSSLHTDCDANPCMRSLHLCRV
jgi:hypothetical protein